jgi:hypothetical protein
MINYTPFQFLFLTFVSASSGSIFVIIFIGCIDFDISCIPLRSIAFGFPLLPIPPTNSDRDIDRVINRNDNFISKRTRILPRRKLSSRQFKILN